MNDGFPQLPEISLPFYMVYVVIMICRDLPQSRNSCFSGSAYLPLAQQRIGKHD
jgi:hypothetical protein